MISDLLNSYLKRSAYEIQFRLGYQTLLKINHEWVESENQNLSLTEWEDLKDLCLKSDEKMTLETKGHIRGALTMASNTWFFSFVEWKENLKAHFSSVQDISALSSIQSSTYWESLNTESGLHIISGIKQSGKSTLLADILDQLKNSSQRQVVIHSDPSVLTYRSHDKTFILGAESIQWSNGHAFYDGIDTVVCDFNDVTNHINLSKWIQFAEQGKKVFLTLSANDIQTVLLQIKSATIDDSSLWFRFSKQLKTVIVQKKMKPSEGAVHELIVMKSAGLNWLNHLSMLSWDIKNKENEFTYQSLNQSIVQSLIKRKIDIKAAFESTNDPSDLDEILKKMGL
jgi:twitching motility protein PilT